MTMADTVAVMNKGVIEQMGPPQELYELPHTAFVATFLGQSNLLSGVVVSASGSSMIVDVAGNRVEVPRERAQRHSGEVTIGIRPEKMTLHGSEPAREAGRNLVGPGRITDVSFSGVSTQYEVTSPVFGVFTVFAQNTSISRMHHDGDEVWMSWDVGHTFGLADEPSTVPAHRFDEDTDTSMIATQRREQLEAELEGA